MVDEFGSTGSGIIYTRRGGDPGDGNAAISLVGAGVPRIASSDGKDRPKAQSIPGHEVGPGAEL